MLTVVVAPDSFKGSLSATEAAEAMKRGVLRARPDARVRVCPLADGGEGTASVLVAAKGGAAHSARVTGPLGRPVVARWALLADGRSAVIESAGAVGLTLVPEAERSPPSTTTYGVGELILAALDAGARSIAVGLGGTATVDGGAGMAQALGVAFGGASRPVTGGQLAALTSVDRAGRDPRVSLVEILALGDVDAPLAGPDGAAHVYGSQKGATRAQAHALDAGLARLGALAGDPGVTAGDGAAGGLGYGLRVLAGARPVSGADFVLDAVGFDGRLEGCDLVLTGEGRIDATSARGKVVSGVARRCGARGIPLVALAGAVGEGAEALYPQGLSACFSLCDRPMSEGAAMQDAALLLERLAENVVRWRLAPAG